MAISQLLEEKYLKKINVTVPRDSIFGRIYENDIEKQVVKSDSFLIYQHNPFRWRVNGDCFEREEDFSTASVMINSIINKSCSEIDNKRLRKIGECLCYVADKTGVNGKERINPMLVMQFADNARRLRGNKQNIYELLRVAKIVLNSTTKSIKEQFQ